LTDGANEFCQDDALSLSKWPDGEPGQSIFIQQDNAKPHSREGDAIVESFCLEQGWNIRLKRQPPNSSDLNVFDLGFFAAIQARRHQEAPTNNDELIQHMNTEFYSMTPVKMDSNDWSLDRDMGKI
jgi:hypothetical protein